MAKEKKDEAFYRSFGADADLSDHKIPIDNVVFSGQANSSKFTSSELTRMKSIASDRVHTRSGFNKADRLQQRSEEELPTGHKAIISTCQAMYRKVGMIRNIIDLMSDFASEGLEIKHPIKSQQRFYQSWARRTDIASRAHDFMKLLLRDANVIVRRKTAIIPKPVAKEMSKAEATAEVVGLTSVEEALVEEKPEKIKKEIPKVTPREIPWQYTFISPTVIEKIGGDIGQFFGGKEIALRIPTELKRAINKPKTKAEQDLIAKLPQEIVSAVKSKTKKGDLVALDPDKMYIDYYKKDDWEDWGTPFLYGILEDVMLKDKMKLADLAALDGVINVTRIWKLGDHKEKILPTEAAVNRLLDILQHNVGGGQQDVIWDSMIDMIVEYPPIDKILGDEKYRAVNRDIMKGLGIPEALVGGVDLATRNAETAFVQLKTLIERLEYVRGKCIRWLQNELAIVARAMGFNNVPTIVFETMSLRDEAAEKQLMIQLVDRGIISDQAIHDLFGLDFATELRKIKEEQKIRDVNPKILEKSNPYYRSTTQLELQHQFKVELEKLKQSGKTGNTDELSERGGDNPNGDQPRDSGDNEVGRPPNTPETNPRDTRTEKTLSVYKVKAEGLMSKIDAIIDPLYLKNHDIKNMRALTKGQTQELENVKLAVLAAIGSDDVVTGPLIHERSKPIYAGLTKVFKSSFEDTLVCHAEILGRPAKLNERRSIAASTWASMRGVT